MAFKNKLSDLSIQPTLWQSMKKIETSGLLFFHGKSPPGMPLIK
jgi:hypothetical protein